MKGIVITADGEIGDFDGEYDELSAAVGGWVEAAPVEADNVTIWCNEEGKLNRLPINLVANHVWAFLGDMGCQANGDFLVGTVVITGGTSPSGKSLSLRDGVRTLIMDHLMAD